MKTSSRTEASLTLFLSWASDRLLRAIVAIRPAHSADQIAADVAASGSPSGA